MARLNREIAQQIAESIKDACGYDINFITDQGIILASTDSARIGTYHEIGMHAAKSGETIEVTEDNQYDGTQKGVNIPFTFHSQLLGVIGITGEPDEVRRYAHLAIRIMRLILREKDLESSHAARRAEASHVIRSLISGENFDTGYVIEFLKSRKLDPKAEYRAILINPLYSEQTRIGTVESTLESFFSSLKGAFFAFEYPSTYILFLESSLFEAQQERLKSLTSLPAMISVGSSQRLAKASLSMRDAVLAQKSRRGEWCVIDDLSLELLFSQVSEGARERYLQKTAGALSEKEIAVLEAYFTSEMSLKETAEKLFIHKNTLQYQLDGIHQKCGLNPRVFSDALRLYLALMLMKAR